MISITFTELTPEQAHALITTHRTVTIKGGDVSITENIKTNEEDNDFDSDSNNENIQTSPEEAFGLGVDAHGVPWDERIHAKNKAKTVAGSWKLKKNVDPLFVKNVITELKGGLVSTSGSIVNPIAATTKTLPPLPQVVTEAPKIPEITFDEICAVVTGAMDSGKLTHTEVVNIMLDFNLPSLKFLHDKPELFQAVLEKVNITIHNNIMRGANHE